MLQKCASNLGVMKAPFALPVTSLILALALDWLSSSTNGMGGRQRGRAREPCLMEGKRSLLSRTIKSGRCASVTCRQLPVCIGKSRTCAALSRVLRPQFCCAPPALPCCIVECGPGVTSVATLHGRIYIILPMTMRAKEKTCMYTT